MKKIISLALATAMVFTMSAVAFAASSITMDLGSMSTPTENVTISEVPAELQEMVASMASMNLTAGLGTDLYDVVSSFAVEFTGTVPADGKVVVENVPGVTAGDVVAVVHVYFGDNGVPYMEYLSAVATADGVVEISGVEHFSSFVISKLSAKTTTPTTTTVSSGFPEGFTYDYPYGYWEGSTFVWNGYFNADGVFVYTTDVAGTTTTASPKTGETNAAAVAACMMLLAGVAVCGLVRKEQL